MTGILHAVGSEIKVNDNFKLKPFIIKVEGDNHYVDYYPFEITNDRITQLDEVKVGDKVHILYSMQGRKSNKTYDDIRKCYFLSLKAYYVGTRDIQHDRRVESYANKKVNN
jgi:hypothetical protein